MQSLVSIVVPIYNVKEYLSECIDSIISQTYDKIEIILVDDGSSDGCAELCDGFAEKDPRVRVLHKENGGLVSSRKAGMNIATGQYIVCVDGDDKIDPKMIETLVEGAIANDVEVVQCGYFEEIENLQMQKPIKSEEYLIKEVDASKLLHSWMNGRPCIGSQIWNKLYRSELFRLCYQNVPDDRNFGEDQIFFIHLLNNMKNFKVLPACLYYYRVRDNSMSHETTDNSLWFKQDNLLNCLYILVQGLGYDITEIELRDWLFREKYGIMRGSLRIYGLDAPYYKFSNPSNLMNQRVVVYGAGVIGKEYIEYISKYEFIQVSAWIDKSPEKYHYDFREVKSISILSNLDYDYIVIAIKDPKVVEIIKTSLIKEYLISEEKILWAEPVSGI